MRPRLPAAPSHRRAKASRRNWQNARDRPHSPPPSPQSFRPVQIFPWREQAGHGRVSHLLRAQIRCRYSAIQKNCLAAFPPASAKRLLPRQQERAHDPRQTNSASQCRKFRATLVTQRRSSRTPAKLLPSRRHARHPDCASPIPVHWPRKDRTARRHPAKRRYAIEPNRPMQCHRHRARRADRNISIPRRGDAEHLSRGSARRLPRGVRRAMEAPCSCRVLHDLLVALGFEFLAPVPCRLP